MDKLSSEIVTEEIHVNEDNKKKVIQAVMNAGREKWSAKSLQWLVTDPFRLDLMMGLLISHRHWLGEAGSPWIWDVANFKNSADPVGPEQHAHFWSLLSTGCSGDHWRDTDAHQFVNNQYLQDQLSVFINNGEEIFTWAVQRILEGALGRRDYPESTKAFHNPSLGLHGWLKGKLALEGLDSLWKIENLRAISVPDLLRPSMGNAILGNAVEPMLTTRLPGKTLLKSLGIRELLQVKELPTHLWKGKRLIGLGDLVRTVQGGDFFCPCIDNLDDKPCFPFPRWIPASTTIHSGDSVLTLA